MSIQRLLKAKTHLSLSVFREIVTNSNRMLDLSAQHPEYAILVSKYYVEIGNQTMKLKQEVSQDILNENKDFLMDASDREMLIEKVLQE